MRAAQDQQHHPGARPTIYYDCSDRPYVPTGEVRPPRMGEPFIERCDEESGWGPAHLVFAQFDFVSVSAEILRPVTPEDSVLHGAACTHAAEGGAGSRVPRHLLDAVEWMKRGADDGRRGSLLAHAPGPAVPRTHTRELPDAWWYYLYGLALGAARPVLSEEIAVCTAAA